MRILAVIDIRYLPSICSLESREFVLACACRRRRRGPAVSFPLSNAIIVAACFLLRQNNLVFTDIMVVIGNDLRAQAGWALPPAQQPRSPIRTPSR